MSQATTPTTVSASTSVSNGTRLKKRRRAPEAEDELSASTRSETFWFDDGNVILHVDNALFRVHRGVLARHSTTFNGMFPVPQPNENLLQNAMVEGCQVVHLKEDKVLDWERVLAVIYDLDGLGKEQYTAQILASLLHLGKKYGLDRICNQVIQRLRQILPKTVQELAGFPKEFSDAMHSVFSLTKIIFDTGNYTLLPTLLLFSSTNPKGKTSAVFQLSASVGMSPAVSQMVIIGRENFFSACTELQFTWVFKSNTDEHVCQQPSICQPAKFAYLQRYIPYPRTVLKSGKEVVEDSTLAKICSECQADILATQEANRKALWDKLPSFFGLPSWDNLRDS